MPHFCQKMLSLVVHRLFSSGRKTSILSSYYLLLSWISLKNVKVSYVWGFRHLVQLSRTQRINTFSEPLLHRAYYMLLLLRFKKKNRLTMGICVVRSRRQPFCFSSAFLTDIVWRMEKSRELWILAMWELQNMICLEFLPLKKKKGKTHKYGCAFL